MPTFKKYGIHLLFLLLSFIFYGSSLKNKYALDDDIVLTENNSVKKGFSGIKEIFTSRYVKIKGKSYDYRPVAVSSFAIEYALFGENSTKSHLINILLYSLCCSILYLFLKNLFQGYSIEFVMLVCLLFLVHPIHSEIVNNVKSRDEILSFLFGFSSLFFYLKAFDTKKNYLYLVGILFFVMSLLSKLSSIGLIPIFPLSLYFFREQSLKKLLKPGLVIICSLIVLIVVKRLFLERVGNFRSGEYYENVQYVSNLNFFERIPMAIYCVIFYIGLFLVPFNLISYYGHEQVPVSQWGDGMVLFALLIIGGLLFIVWKYRKKYPVLSFGILFYFLSISVFTNLLRPAPGVVAERFATIASVGLCIALTFLIFRVFSVDIKGTKKHKSSIFVYGLTGLIALIFLGITVNRNRDWYDLETLVSTDVEKAPKSVKLHTLYGSVLMSKLKPGNPMGYQEKVNTFKLAIFHLETAIELYPEHSIAWNNLGTLYFKSNRITEARSAYFKAIKFNPEYAMAHNNLGDLYQSFNQVDSANYYYKKASDLVLAEKKKIKQKIR